MTHHTMLLSRKLLSWGLGAVSALATATNPATPAAVKSGSAVVNRGSAAVADTTSATATAAKSAAWLAELHAHADWLDVALYNGVLGTQRGKQAGAMVYMLPLGEALLSDVGTPSHACGNLSSFSCM